MRMDGTHRHDSLHAMIPRAHMVCVRAAHLPDARHSLQYRLGTCHDGIIGIDLIVIIG